MTTLDANGCPLAVGDMVRSYRRGSDVIAPARRATLPSAPIEAIGSGALFAGMVRVVGIWSSPDNFEKVTP